PSTPRFRSDPRHARGEGEPAARGTAGAAPDDRTAGDGDHRRPARRREVHTRVEATAAAAVRRVGSVAPAERLHPAAGGVPGEAAFERGRAPAVEGVEEPRSGRAEGPLGLLPDDERVGVADARRVVLRAGARPAAGRPADGELALVDLADAERRRDGVVLRDDPVAEDILDDELDRLLRGIANRVPGLLDRVLHRVEGVLNAVGRALEERLDRISEPRRDRVDNAVLDEVPGVLDRVAHRVEARLESLDHRADHRPEGVSEPRADGVDRGLDRVPDGLRDNLPALEGHL